MKLKRLEIVGFKSFAERTTLDFNADITGIVGPNGCGKSNVVDAIRWVMGELSAKHLRGNAMADVIFNGTEARGPMGMAEVTLTLINDGENVPPHYASYQEIAVQRRLYRNGESDYSINKTPVRLKDIQELFMDTGVGTKGAYAIIEQGRIGSILTGHPEERRKMIEEVAGITKFRNRRQTAERRLDSTRQSMQRLDDILSELRKRVNSLKRQADQARRYKKLKAELGELEQRELTQRFLEATAHNNYLQSIIATEEQSELSLSNNVATLEAKLETIFIEKAKLEDQLSLLRTQEQDLSTKEATLQRDLLYGNDEIEASMERTETTKKDIADSHNQRERMKMGIDEINSLLEALQNEFTEHESKVEEQTQALRSLQHSMTEVIRDTDLASSKLIELVETISKNRNNLEHLNRQLADMKVKKQQAEKNLGGLREEQSDIQERHSTLSQRIELCNNSLESLQIQEETINEQLEILKTSITSQQADMASLQERLTNKASRLESLEEIERNLEGYSEGVRFLLSSEHKNNTKGIVSEVLKVPSHLELAVEALLSERLQYLMVESFEDAGSLLSSLKESSEGRAGFILPQPFSIRDDIPADTTHAGWIGKLNELVQVKQDNPTIVNLLKNVWVVDGLQNALDFYSSSKDLPVAIVTLEGDVLESNGLFRGGSQEAVSTGLLARRREMDELNDEIHKLKGQFHLCNEKLNHLQEEQSDKIIRFREITDAITQDNLKKVSLGKDLEQINSSLQNVNERIEVLEFDIEQATIQQSEFEEQITVNQQQIEDAEGKRSNIDEELTHLKELKTSLENQIEVTTEELSQARIKLAEVRQRRESTQNSFKDQEQLHKDLNQRIERLTEQLKKEELNRERTKQNLIHAQEEVKLVSTQLEETKARLAKTHITWEEINASTKDDEDSIRQLRSQLEKQRTQLNQTMLKKERWIQELRQLSDTAYTFHQLPISDFVYLYHHMPMLGPDEERRKKIVSEKLQKIGGEVNLLAIDEYQEASERHDHLASQKQDLQQAMDDLIKAIAKIEKTSRQRFREAFYSVNEAFKLVFEKLFNGGQAELVLMNEQSPLEGGLEIVAQPPGKRLQSLSLLSGGEKALTAAAMVFALFLVRPSPFCLLDEVDAPLDEANIQRFLDLIRELSSKTQFIMITHSQMSMSAADLLYGVTMQESGISKLVSIRLTDNNDLKAA